MKNLLYILVLMLALFITGCATSEAGKNRTVSSGDTVVLDGSSSSSSSNKELEYRWSQTEGDTVDLEGANTVRATFVAPEVNKDTLLKFQLDVIEVNGYPVDRDYVTITVKPRVDTIKPTIILNGNSEANITVGDSYIEAGAKASDDRDGDITDKIVITSDVNSSKIGTYHVKYNVSDEAENKAYEVIRTINVVSVSRDYGTFGDLNVSRFPEAEGSLHDNYVVYYPKDAITTDMPVVVFLEGGGEEPKIDDYRGIMEFLASKGYFVIGAEQGADYNSSYAVGIVQKAIDTAIEHHGLNLEKVAVMGHSQGGGQAFFVMKDLQDRGYGSEASLALSLDGWFALGMNRSDLNALKGEIGFIQMNGLVGTGTDPRIKLTIWNLSTQSEKAFYTLPSNDHSYVAGNLANVLGKQDLLFSIGALTDDAFTGSNDGANAIPQTSKASYNDISNALEAEDTYSSGDCKGIQYNAINTIKNNDINYCDFEATYPPETTLTRKIVNSVDRPLAKFSSYLDVAFDATVKRTVTRLTNREQDNKGFNNHQYPKQGSAWNSDMSLLRLQGRVYDAETLIEIPLTKNKTGREVYNLMKAPQSGSSGIRWSKYDAHVLYVMSAEKKFYKLTISANRTTMTEEVIVDLSASARPYFNIGQNEGNIDYDDKYVVLTSLDGNDVYATLLDIKAKNLVWGPQKLTFTKSEFDWMSISPSGNYILISANHTIRLYNRNLDLIRVLANRAEHGDIGYAPDGSEMYVQFHSGGVGIFGFVLNDNPLYEEPIKLLDSNHGGGHISCQNYKRKGWCYVGTREDGYREVYALKLDGSKTVQRFAKTNARGSEDPILGDANNYHYATHPTAIPSPYGTRALFWSDYGNPEELLYVYKDINNTWHTTDDYYNRDTYQVRISK